jgi:hypothetical protein
MPLLSLRLTNTDNSNKCVVHLPHEVRTQEMKVKQTRVHFNHAKHTEATGNYYTLVNRTSSDANVQHRQLEVPRTSALATVFSPANVLTGSLVEYGLASTASAANLPMFEPGFYYVDVEFGNASVDTTTYPNFLMTFHIQAGNFSATQRILSHVQAGSDHAHHRFRVVSNMLYTDFERVPSSLRTVHVDMPWISGYEITSNVSGGGQIPCPVDPSKPVTESSPHCLLKAESVPASFTCELFADDGVTPLQLSQTAFGSVREVNVLLEYSTNSLFF